MHAAPEKQARASSRSNCPASLLCPVQPRISLARHLTNKLFLGKSACSCAQSLKIHRLPHHIWQGAKKLTTWLLLLAGYTPGIGTHWLAPARGRARSQCARQGFHVRPALSARCARFRFQRKALLVRLRWGGEEMYVLVGGRACFKMFGGIRVWEA